METSRSTPGDVVSIGKHSAYKADFKGLASQRLRAARERLGIDHAAFAAVLTELLGWGVTEAAYARWERHATPPGDVLLAATAAEEGGLAVRRGAMLATVPGSFPADALSGHWVTCYQFTHNGISQRHADIAHVTAESDRRIWAVNHPPEPRTEGRANPFHNEIQAELASRHLIGNWKNTSDTRYFGSLQLAVLPSEMVMEGHFTGFGNDVEVSAGSWKWVRLEIGSLPEDGLRGIVLREPSALYDLVMNRPQYDAPLTLADVREDDGTD